MDVVMLRIVNALIRLACAATLTVRRDYPADEPHTKQKESRKQVYVFLEATAITSNASAKQL